MKVFVVSSSEAVSGGDLDRVVGWIRAAGHDPVPWNDGVFKPGTNTLQVLLSWSNRVDAAICLFRPDDVVRYRNKKFTKPRDNVHVEFGLFVGRLGETRAVVGIVGNAMKPSDMDGIGHIDLRNRRTAGKRIQTWLEGITNPQSRAGTRLTLTYTNAWSMDDHDEYWRGWSAKAKKRFCLIGVSNKSWITHKKNDQQRFASHIVSLIQSGGEVSIVSAPSARDSHLKFFEEDLIPIINALKRDVRRALNKMFQKNFKYGTSDNTTYRAVLSDEMLVLMPRLCDLQFNAHESMVLELPRQTHKLEFDNYERDIQRLASSSVDHSAIRSVSDLILR